jgi:hypothetical protein
VAQTHPIRRLGTRAALLSIGMALGVTLAPRVVGATDQPVPPVETESESTVPATVAPAATSTSTSTSTSSSTSTTTTLVTTPPPTIPPELVPPLVVDFRQPEVGDALRVNRTVVAASRTQQARPAAVAELPFTGGGTASILMSGLTALGIGGLALWWGSRKRPELEPVELRPTE